MILKAYKQIINSAHDLPEKINGQEYFNDLNLNPQKIIIDMILEKARLDIDCLSECEFIKLVEYNRNWEKNNAK